MGKKSFLSTPGMGQALTTWIPMNAMPQLDELAARRNVSRSTLARYIILGFLNALNGETPIA